MHKTTGQFTLAYYHSISLFLPPALCCIVDSAVKLQLLNSLLTDGQTRFSQGSLHSNIVKEQQCSEVKVTAFNIKASFDQL